MSVAQSYQYDDGSEACGTDTFIREPFVVMFSSNHSGTAGGRRATQVPPPAPVKPLHSSASSFAAVENFVVIPQHTSPDFALEETDALYDVVQDVRSRWNTNVSAL